MLTVIILLIIIAITGLIIFKIFKKLLTTILSLIFILIIFTIIIISLVYIDINNLQKNLQTSDNLILLEDNQLLTGLILNLQKNNQKYLSEQELTPINPRENNYYKTIVLKIKFLENNLEDNTLISNRINLTKTQIISILKSNEPIKDFETYTNNEITIPQTDKVKFKAHILTLTLKDIPINLILKEYKNKNLEIYPETITFKIIKLIPNSILNNIQ